MESDIGLVFIGWLLGLLGPPIVDRISNSYKRESFKKSIQTELDDLKIRLVLLVFAIREKMNTIDLSLIEWAHLKISNYKGNESIDGIKMLTKKILSEKIENHPEIFRLINESEFKGLSLKIIPTPILDSNITNIHIFNSKYQTRIVEIKYRISILNQEITSALEFMKMTFDSSLSIENRQIIEKEIRNKYGNIAVVSEILADKISNRDN